MRTPNYGSARLRWGMVGGGLESGIGATHRYAAQIDGNYELVAGVFSTDGTRNVNAAHAFGVAPDRTYSTFGEMAEKERARNNGIQVVSIVAPNPEHVPASLAFIECGIDVICDKPLAVNLDDALRLEQKLLTSPQIFTLTHHASGFPMVREAREQIAAGAIGDVRLVQVEHAGAFGVELLEKQGVARMAWRTDGRAVGESAVLADVGVHAHHLARFVSGLEFESVLADLSTKVSGRSSDDNAHLMFKMSNGASGMLWASFVAAGHRLGLKIRVYGSKGSILWRQEVPDELWLMPQQEPHRLLKKGEPWLCEYAHAASRVNAGQVEGQLEAFANIYSDFADLVRERRFGVVAPFTSRLCPTVADGVLGMRFIETCVQSHRQSSKWIQLET